MQQTKRAENINGICDTWNIKSKTMVLDDLLFTASNNYSWCYMGHIKDIRERRR